MWVDLTTPHEIMGALKYGWIRASMPRGRDQGSVGYHDLWVTRAAYYPRTDRLLLWVLPHAGNSDAMTYGQRLLWTSGMRVWTIM